MNAHFVVEGAFITDTARSLWNDEGALEKAMSIMECVHGMTKDQAMAVLEGRSKLVGDSDTGIMLVDDGEYKGKTLQQALAQMREEHERVADELADQVQMVSRDVVMVASPTGRRLIPRRKAQRLSSRTSYSGMTVAEGYEFDDVLRDNLRDSPPGTKPLRVWEALDPQDPMPQMKDVLAVAEREREARTIPVVREEPEEPKPPPPPKGHKRISYHTGWLSPEGKFYPCRHAQHARTAWSLGLTDNPYNHSIEVHGWARLGEFDGRQYFFGPHDTFNDTVNEKIREYCKRKKIELPFWLDKETK